MSEEPAGADDVVPSAVLIDRLHAATRALLAIEDAEVPMAVRRAIAALLVR